ncbi:MAG: hypothetical protein HQM13_15245 [SAR324 cluster bacterium]|nr:hypothetical protein [SAR324 cluster bacterium]
MSFIREVEAKNADGLLKELYDEIQGRLGRLPAVLSVLSINPEALKGLRVLNRSVTAGGSTLGRRLEELISTHISKLNQCHY